MGGGSARATAERKERRSRQARFRQRTALPPSSAFERTAGVTGHPDVPRCPMIPHQTRNGRPTFMCRHRGGRCRARTCPCIHNSRDTNNFRDTILNYWGIATLCVGTRLIRKRMVFSRDGDVPPTVGAAVPHGRARAQAGWLWLGPGAIPRSHALRGNAISSTLRVARPGKPDAPRAAEPRSLSPAYGARAFRDAERPLHGVPTRSVGTRQGKGSVRTRNGALRRGCAARPAGLRRRDQRRTPSPSGEGGGRAKARAAWGLHKPSAPWTKWTM